MKTIRMKKADWEKWDAALRSGKYLQGTGCLRYENAFCCLGVLQMCLDGAIQDNKGVLDSQLPSLQWLSAHDIAFDSLDHASGDAINRAPAIDIRGEVDTAAMHNDDGKCFHDIADAIKDAVEFTDA